jgi:hypothetical protein
MQDQVQFSITPNHDLCGPVGEKDPTYAILLTEEKKGTKTSTCLVPSGGRYPSGAPLGFEGGWNVRQASLNPGDAVALHDTFSLEFLPEGSTLDSDNTWVSVIVAGLKAVIKMLF